MTHGSLFLGIGGFDLAAEWMGWENIFHCEWNPFGQRVLKYHFPKSISYNDITKTDLTIHRGAIDILTGGFPCQPYSLAGKRKGKEDERHLWPEMLRAIREIQPRWVVGENVFGLINWSGGLVFHEVQTDLETQGYEVFPYVLPAAAVNAPHRRDRIWFIAYKHSECMERSQSIKRERGEREQVRSEIWDKDRAVGGIWANTDTNSINRGRKHEHEQESGDVFREPIKDMASERSSSDTKIHSSGGELQQQQGKGKSGGRNRIEFQSDTPNPNSTRRGKGNKEMEKGSPEQSDGTCIQSNDAHTSSQGLQGSEHFGSIREERKESTDEQFIRQFCNQWEEFPTQSSVCTGNDGFPTKLDGITFPKWRNESIKAAGNAIVPQVALQIFKSIEQYESF